MWRNKYDKKIEEAARCYAEENSMSIKDQREDLILRIFKIYPDSL